MDKRVRSIIHPVLSLHSINPPITRCGERRMLTLDEIFKCLLYNAVVEIVTPNGEPVTVNESNVNEVFEYTAKYTMQEESGEVVPEEPMTPLEPSTPVVPDPEPEPEVPPVVEEEPEVIEPPVVEDQEPTVEQLPVIEETEEQEVVMEKKSKKK